MNFVAISLRYAKALFLSAKEHNILEEVHQNLDLIKNTLKANQDFLEVINNPVVKESKKITIFQGIFGESINQLTLDFLILLVNKNRETSLLDIIRIFAKLYYEETNTKIVVVSTKVPINKETEQSLENIIKEKFNAKAEIESIIDHNMIGGIKVRVDNLLLDLSVRNQLQEIKKHLKKEVYKVKF